MLNRFSNFVAFKFHNLFKQTFFSFCEALVLYQQKDFNLMKRFIFLTWTINPNTNFKKIGSFEKDLQKLRQTKYFERL